MCEKNNFPINIYIAHTRFSLYWSATKTVLRINKNLPLRVGRCKLKGAVISSRVVFATPPMVHNQNKIKRVELLAPIFLLLLFYTARTPPIQISEKKNNKVVLNVFFFFFLSVNYRRKKCTYTI